MEFGTRRAQEMDAAIWGTRAAVIGGANGTSNVRAGKLFGIPVLGTHAHSLGTGLWKRLSGLQGLCGNP